MCDTMVMMGNATKNGHVYFGKNSDRHPNEAQEPLIIPGRDHAPSDMQKCTYITIPQVKRTNTVLISKPFWMWGCEIGANEFGVVIGNEAVFTKEDYQKTSGLTGMDLIRLSLQRAASSSEALKVIISLLEEYGQGGNCGFDHSMFYHNSFIITDPNEAWVLETAGKHWAAKRVIDIYTISNAITLGNDFDMASDQLVSNAIEKGWCKDKKQFNFAKNYSDFLYTTFSDSHNRQSCSFEQLKESIGSADVTNMFSALQSHGNGHEPYNPGKKLTGAQVCMHTGFGPVRESQSVASLVADLTVDNQTYWITGTSAPCTSLFKPVWIDAGIPDIGQSPVGEYDETSLFWQHELLHRRIIKNYEDSMQLGRQEQMCLQAKFVEQSQQAQTQGVELRQRLSQDCFTQAGEFEKVWQKLIVDKSIESKEPILYKSTWKNINRKANIDKLLN